MSDEHTRDSARLDWLSRQYVTVRRPMRYGSKVGFCGSPDIEDTDWNLRAAIDAAMTGGLAPAAADAGESR